MAGRKLRERLGIVNTNPEPQPELKVPDADKASALVDAAESGFAAIQALYVDRNKSVELAQSLHQHNVYLHNMNNGLKAELAHARLERDILLKSNARLGAWIAQAHDLFKRVAHEVGQTTTVIEQMPPPPTATPDPDTDPVDARGLPVPDDQEALPLDPDTPAATIVSDKTVRELIDRLQSHDRNAAAMQ